MQAVWLYTLRGFKLRQFSIIMVKECIFKPFSKFM